MSRFYNFLVWIDKKIWDKPSEEYLFFEVIWLLSFGLFFLIPIIYFCEFLEWINKYLTVRSEP